MGLIISPAYLQISSVGLRSCNIHLAQLSLHELRIAFLTEAHVLLISNHLTLQNCIAAKSQN